MKLLDFKNKEKKKKKKERKQEESSGSVQGGLQWSEGGAGPSSPKGSGLTPEDRPLPWKNWGEQSTGKEQFLPLYPENQQQRTGALEKQSGFSVFSASL